MMPPKAKKAKLQEGQLTMGFEPLGFQFTAATVHIHTAGDETTREYSSLILRVFD